MKAAELRIMNYIGGGIAPVLPALAALRTEVFRDWPYLYDGDTDYEQNYLSVYPAQPRAMVTVALQDDKIIGAATCLPMISAAPEISAPLQALGLDPRRYFYFGESVLLPAYRGHGLGVGFFAAREAHALADADCDHALFYSVRRETEHPARPADALPLDGFWRNRGFSPVTGLSCRMSWREVGQTQETIHTLDAWGKRLKPAP